MAQSLCHLPKVIWLVDNRIGFEVQVFRKPNPVLFHCILMPFLKHKIKITQESFAFQNLRKDSSEYLMSFKKQFKDRLTGTLYCRKIRGLSSKLIFSAYDLWQLPSLSLVFCICKIRIMTLSQGSERIKWDSVLYNQHNNRSEWAGNKC